MSGLLKWIDDRAAKAPDAPALLAPDAWAMTWSELAADVRAIGARVRAAGAGRDARVAVVLPNGPDAARAFLGVGAFAACAPLNPSFREAEIDRACDELEVAAVVVSPTAEDGAAARAVAVARGLPIIGLRGLGELGAPGRTDVDLEPLGADEPALVLQTSGTTSRPKTVPLAARQVLASARNVAATLELTGDDQCLNVMPLFHIHGLIAAVLGSLEAGGSVFCTEGFAATRFLDRLDESDATWTTAVPTILQGILGRVRDDEAARRVRESRIRFVRSSSASLPPTVLEGLEEALGVPVVEAYGMTEAAHQMCSNPLPPATRKPGAVGPPAGPEVAVQGTDGALLATGEIGEVVIRGENVFSGYADPPEANADAFREGWFRTGDQGRLDADGYLVLTGRLKELINRGGEKIAPREIDEALLEHPDVEQAVAFAVTHPRLGEEVCAAVVSREGSGLDARGLVDFAAKSLSDFKLPKRVLFVDAIPKGPTGKLQRIGLADQLGVEPFTEESSDSGVETPATDGERAIADLFEEVLEIAPIGRTSDFFGQGGDSLLATQLIQAVLERIGVDLPLAVVFETPTVAAIAAYCAEARPRDESSEDGVPPVDGPVPLAFGQRAIWTQERLVGPTPALLCAHAFRLSGRLDVERLQGALGGVVGAHDALRTRFVAVGGAPGTTVDPASPVTLVVEPADEALIAAVAREEASTPLDLEHPPLWRARLLRESDDSHVLFWTAHHAIFDGWSTTRFQDELMQRYRGDDPREVMPYRDLAWRQHCHAERGGFELAIDAWRARLAGRDGVFELPADRSDDGSDTTGDSLVLDVPPETRARLVSLAKETGVTLFTVLLAAVTRGLARITGEDDVVLGTLDSGRAAQEADRVIGMFVNQLVMRVDHSGDPSSHELVARCRAVVLDALTHRDLPFERLVRALKPPVVLGRNPYFEVLFQLRNLPRPARGSGPISMKEIELERGKARFDLHIEAIDEDGRLRLLVEYRTARFDRSTIDRWVGTLRESLESLTVPQ